MKMNVLSMYVLIWLWRPQKRLRRKLPGLPLWVIYCKMLQERKGAPPREHENASRPSDTRFVANFRDANKAFPIPIFQSWHGAKACEHSDTVVKATVHGQPSLAKTAGSVNGQKWDLDFALIFISKRINPQCLKTTTKRNKQKAMCFTSAFLFFIDTVP